MKTSKSILIACSLILPVLFGGWGSVGHKIINTNITSCFPSTMSYFTSWSSSLASHASDADSRKSKDKTEGPKHYIDIENFSGWVSTGWLPRPYDSAVVVYGSTLLTAEGWLPWATLKTVDSLTSLFKAKNYTQAALVAADLGHYVGDGHQPLHITNNYDGDETGQSGVHSRYETDMIKTNQSLLVYDPIPATYISDKASFVFDYINQNHKYVDSIMIADKAGTLWGSCGAFTIKFLQEASYKTASLIYTAWVDAGSPDMTVGVENENNRTLNKEMTLSAFPNPFNPDVTIEYAIPESVAQNGSNMNVSVYSQLGELVTTLANAPATAGISRVHFNGSRLSSGVYYVVLKSGAQMTTKKIALMK
jgi:hypothetical protein